MMWIKGGMTIIMDVGLVYEFKETGSSYTEYPNLYSVVTGLTP